MHMCRCTQGNMATIKVATFNGSSWPSTKDWIVQLGMETIMIATQEHHLVDEQSLEFASAWMVAKGWKAFSNQR